MSGTRLRCFQGLVLFTLLLGVTGCPPPKAREVSDPILGGWTAWERNVGLLFLANGECIGFVHMPPEMAYDEVPPGMPLDKEIWVPHTRATWKRTGSKIILKTTGTIWATKGDPHSAFTVVRCADRVLVVKWDQEKENMSFRKDQSLKPPKANRPEK